MAKTMFTQRTTTILLIIAITALSYQTFALAMLTSKLEDANIGLGAAPSAVSFTDDGSAPDMVGGC